MYQETTLDKQINSKKTELLHFAAMSECDIKAVWKNPTDIDIDDCSNIPYRFDLPLYAKMILRFQRECARSPNRLHRQIDPCNQQRLLATYDLSGQKNIIDFFAWLDDNQGAYHMAELEGPCVDIDTSEYVAKWRESSIKFFFWLDESKQNKLIRRYFKNWHESLNESFRF